MSLAAQTSRFLLCLFAPCPGPAQHVISSATPGSASFWGLMLARPRALIFILFSTLESGQECREVPATGAAQ